MNVRFAEGEYVPRRGGNYNNTSNAGLGYENCNNVRANANVNYAARPRSRSNEKMTAVYATLPHYALGGVRFHLRVCEQHAENENPCALEGGLHKSLI